jgi:hypothetical protein
MKVSDLMNFFKKGFEYDVVDDVNEFSISIKST